MCATTPKERLQSYARHKFGSVKALELECGLANGTLGSNQEMSTKTLQKVMDVCPELSLDWLMLGLGKMERSIELPPKKEKEKKEDAVAEQTTNIYHLNLQSKDMVTIPASLLQQLQLQIAEKDKQISQLLNLLSK